MPSLKRPLRHYPAALPAIIPGGDHPLASANPRNVPDNVTLMGYGPDGWEESNITCMQDIATFAAKWPVTWVDIDGVGNAALINELGKAFGLDRLVLEDIFDVHHLPKVEEYEKYIFLILKNGLQLPDFQTEQVSLVLTDKIVITIQEAPGDSFQPLRKRIRSGAGRIRQFGSDYLAYAVIDATIESYYPILEAMKNRLDSIEDTFLDAGSANVIRRIHDIKNELLFLHSAVWPVYDITQALAHKDTPIVRKATAHYLRDCQDQAKRVSDLSEFYRLLASDLMNTYLAFSDNKANEIMKVLTMVATIFIPLSFIASLYGMNFSPDASPYNMPELRTRYGYPVALLVMLTIASGILAMFWRNGWIGRRRRKRR